MGWPLYPDDRPGRASARSVALGAALLVVLLLAGCASGTPAAPASPAAPTVSGDLAALLTSAQAALDSGNLSAAEQSYRAAVSRDPESGQAQFGLGNTLVRLGKLAEAETAYKAALAADPGMIAAHANLGVTYYQMTQLTKAAR